MVPVFAITSCDVTEVINRTCGGWPSGSLCKSFILYLGFDWDTPGINVVVMQHGMFPSPGAGVFNTCQDAPQPLADDITSCRFLDCARANHTEVFCITF